MSKNDPNKLLLVQNIPNLEPAIVHEMLVTLFKQCVFKYFKIRKNKFLIFCRFEGLKEVRMAPGRGVAFVEFENEIQSSRARDGLQNFKVAPEFPLSVSFAK